MKPNPAEATVEPLIAYFDKLIPLDVKEKQLVSELFKPRLYRKKQYVLQEGDQCNHMNFVVRGVYGCTKLTRKAIPGQKH